MATLRNSVASLWAEYPLWSTRRGHGKLSSFLVFKLEVGSCDKLNGNDDFFEFDETHVEIKVSS
jgi:hypothetical protein